MYAQVEKSKENKSRAVANSVAQKKSNLKQSFGFVDNRPETSLQRKNRTIIDNSSNSYYKSGLSSNEIKNHGEVVQCDTEFKFKKRQLTYNDGGGVPKTEMVAEEAEAWIDPANAVQGTTTPPSSGVYSDMGLTQGHLINAQVGGPGIGENFFPITPSLNSQHKNNIELPLKYNVVTLRTLQGNGAPWTNRHLYYKAKAVPASWAAFDATNQNETQFQCEMAYTSANHKILSSLPATVFTATDATALVHTNLDNELNVMGAGAPGPPTGVLGGRHYTLGPAVLGGIGQIRDLFLNGTKIGTAEE